MGRTSWPTLRKGGVRGERYLWLASWAALLKSIPSLPGQPCKSHFWFPLAVLLVGMSSQVVSTDSLGHHSCNATLHSWLKVQGKPLKFFRPGAT